MNQPVRTAFDREYQVITADLVRMSEMVSTAIEQAMQALTERNITLAQQVIDNDEQVNALRFRLEEECLTLIATRQPIAGDLRRVVAALHIIDEIERMGDHAAGIGKTVLLMKEEPLTKVIKKIPKMAELSRQMLADSIQAFLARDETWAQKIAAQDAEMDQMYKEVFDKLVEIMGEKKGMVTRATYMMWCAHNLERIADRVTNIAERVIFMTTGDLRELNV
jgi:phosphate transport system protein